MESDSKQFQDPRFANAMMSLVHCGVDEIAPVDIAWRICDNVQSALQLDDVVLYLLNDDGSELVQTAASGAKNPTGREILNPISIPVGSGIVGAVGKTGHAEVISDSSKDPRYILDDENRLSEISVPLIQSGRVIGVLDSEEITRGFYSSDHLSKLEALASVAAAHIARALSEIKLEHASLRMGQLEKIASRQIEINEQLGALEKWHSHMDKDATQILHHELRTPLIAIMGISDLLDDICLNKSCTDKKLTRFAGMLRRSGQDLLDRISNLLDLPGLSPGVVSPVRNEVDITRLLQEVISRVSHKIEERGLRLEFDVPAHARTVRCDRVALEKVIFHLLDNAIKFTPRGTVLVRLEVDKNGIPVALVVVDQGIGIDDEYLEKIYQPFFQIDQGLNRQYTGLGPGLSTARRLCGGMGYSLEVDSKPGFGTTIRAHMGGLLPG